LAHKVNKAVGDRRRQHRLTAGGVTHRIGQLGTRGVLEQIPRCARFDRAQAYWTKLGWSAKAPIKTESRIDVPRGGQRVPTGPVTFGGVAWAQNRGVRAVEVRIDDGPWQPADLGAAYSNDTWRLWSYRWTATSGSHTISVRATDNTGAVQTSEETGVVPDGATGWHTVVFSVS